MLEHYTLRDALHAVFQEYPRSYLDVNTAQLDLWLSRSFYVELPRGWGYLSLVEILPHYSSTVLAVPARVVYEEMVDLGYGPSQVASVFLSYDDEPVFMVIHF